MLTIALVILGAAVCGLVAVAIVLFLAVLHAVGVDARRQRGKWSH